MEKDCKCGGGEGFYNFYILYCNITVSGRAGGHHHAVTASPPPSPQPPDQTKPGSTNRAVERRRSLLGSSSPVTVSVTQQCRVTQWHMTVTRPGQQLEWWKTSLGLTVRTTTRMEMIFSKFHTTSQLAILLSNFLALTLKNVIFLFKTEKINLLFKKC